MREITALGSRLSVAPPHQDGYVLSLALTGLFHACASDETEDAQVEWRLRASPDVGGVLPMGLGPTGFEAVIPTHAEALQGIACACHIVGVPKRSWSYAWLFALAAGLGLRRRFVR